MMEFERWPADKLMLHHAFNSFGTRAWSSNAGCDMNVCVTGGTGFVGQEILAQLRSNGHSLSILARGSDGEKRRRAEEGFAAEFRTGTVSDPASLKEAFGGTEAVIHLVGIIGEVGENTFERVHAVGTENVVRAARETGVKRLVHMSALGARANAVSRYHKSKWEGEGHVRRSGLDYTIFRPSIIYGPGDQFVNRFERMARYSPVLPIPGRGEGTMQPLPVRDVALAFVRAIEKPESIGQTYDLVGPDILKLEQILDAILEVTQRHRLKVHIPAAVASVQAAVFEAVFPALLRKPSPLSQDQLIMLEERTMGSMEPARSLFGLELPGFREGIARYLAPKPPAK